MHVLVTGANGIVGKHLCARLRADGHRVYAAVRSAERAQGLQADETLQTGDLAAYTHWPVALHGIEVVAHLAARVHQLRETADSRAAYRQINTEVTRRLANAAVQTGVKRLVFVSTAHVSGLESHEGALTENDPPAPHTAYAQSKWEAEQALWEVCRGSGLEGVVLRPPLVYGPNVKGNLLRLLRVVERGWPLPFGSLRNRRSMIGLGNLVDVIARCVTHPAAAQQTFMVADGEDLSTPELIRLLAAGLGRPARLLRFPPGLLLATARLLGKQETLRRLCGSLQLDCRKLRERLEWRAPIPVEEGMREMTQWYLAGRGQA